MKTIIIGHTTYWYSIKKDVLYYDTPGRKTEVSTHMFLAGQYAEYLKQRAAIRAKI